MIHPNSYFRKLGLISSKWGGMLIYATSEEFSNLQKNTEFAKAPFTQNQIGFFWESKQIFWSASMYGKLMPSWHDLLHEMGHVFASEYPPEYDKCDETAFHGWEYIVARHIRAPIQEWLDGNADYQIVSFCECCAPHPQLEYLSLKCRNKYLREQRQAAVSSGRAVRKNKRLVPLALR